jgi:hypothetical protein
MANGNDGNDEPCFYVYRRGFYSVKSKAIPVTGRRGL